MGHDCQVFDRVRLIFQELNNDPFNDAARARRPHAVSRVPVDVAEHPAEKRVEWMKEAEREYKQLLKLKPDSASVYYNLAVLYSGQKRYKEAVKEYEESLKLNPRMVIAHNNLGIVYALMNNYERAEEKFKEAAQVDPENSRVYLNLGNLYYFKQNNQVKAKAAYEKALKRNPNLKSARKHLQTIIAAQESAKKAEQNFEDSLLKEPETVDSEEYRQEDEKDEFPEFVW